MDKQKIMSFEFPKKEELSEKVSESIERLPEKLQVEAKELAKELGERETVAYLNAISLTHELGEKGAKFPDTALALYKAVQLGINPESGITNAAKVTFSSEFWKKSLTTPPKDAEIIRHLIDGNNTSGQEIAKYFKENNIENGVVGDFGKGAGNTALAVLRACQKERLSPTIEGVEISEDLAKIADERIKEAGFSEQVNARNIDLLSYLKNPENDDVKLDAATIIYSIHHLSHNKYILEALEKGEISFKDNQYYFTPKINLGDGENTEISIPLPSFEQTLKDYNKADAQQIIDSIKRGEQPKINSDNFHDWQQESFELLAKKMKPGAKVCIFDPDEGTSKGFNGFHLNRAINGEENGLMSGMEIGFASFNNINDTVRRLKKAGFEVEKAILQIRLKPNKDEKIGKMVAMEQDVNADNYGKQLGQYKKDEIDDILGHGVIAHKKSN